MAYYKSKRHLLKENDCVAVNSKEEMGLILTIAQKYDVPIHSERKEIWSRDWRSGVSLIFYYDIQYTTLEPTLTATQFIAKMMGIPTESDIEITVKINGKTAKLSDISEDTLQKLREVE